MRDFETLRALVLEAIAQRMFKTAHPDGDWFKSGSGARRREVWRSRAVPALDAVVDVLEDRADIEEALSRNWKRQAVAFLGEDT